PHCRVPCRPVLPASWPPALFPAASTPCCVPCPTATLPPLRPAMCPCPPPTHAALPLPCPLFFPFSSSSAPAEQWHDGLGDHGHAGRDDVAAPSMLTLSRLLVGRLSDLPGVVPPVLQQARRAR
uniref:Uncharacterized protein n=1 Tax=Triticum urartu TaxID=4572 RepID=A0A8R7PD22_TRIUA